MCNSAAPKKKSVKAGNLHEEKGGFHVIELNSPINISGSTMFFLFLLLCLALGIWLYLRDRRQEKRRVRTEQREEREREREERERRRECDRVVPPSANTTADLTHLLPLLSILRAPPPTPSVYPALPPPVPDPYSLYPLPPPSFASPPASHNLPSAPSPSLSLARYDAKTESVELAPRQASVRPKGPTIADKESRLKAWKDVANTAI